MLSGKVYAVFEAELKEITALINEPVALIDQQVKAFEEKQKEEKKAAIKATYDENIGDLAEVLPFEKIFDSRYLNQTYKLATAQKEIVDKIDTVKTDLETIDSLDSKYKEERRRKKEDSKVRKTKKLLSSYRRIKATLSDGEQFTPEEQAELRWKFVEDLMGNTREIAGKSERTIKDTERKREEDLYCVFRIEKATEMYREECEKSGSEEAKRRYRELSMMYLDEKPYTVQEISEVENISDKTVYKDIGIACGIVAIYLLGADF